MKDSLENLEVCEEICFNSNDNLKSSLEADEIYYDLAEFFRLFGDTARLKILHVLFIKETCVCDLSKILEMSQSSISHKLKIMRQYRIVRPRKEGKMVYYSLNDDHVKTIFDMGLAHLLHAETSCSLSEKD